MTRDGKNIPVPVESHEPKRAILPSADSRKDEQLPSPVLVGRPQGGDQPERDPEDAHLWEGSLVARPALVATEQIDFNDLRNLLFSIRDQGVYCPMCRCPEWSSQFPDMRTSHYEACSLGLACEQLLRLYPKEGASVKWRK